MISSIVSAGVALGDETAIAYARRYTTRGTTDAGSPTSKLQRRVMGDAGYSP